MNAMRRFFLLFGIGLIFPIALFAQFSPGTITPQTKPDTFSFNTLPKIIEVLSVTPATGGDGNYTYQWKINDVVIDTATAINYYPTFTTNGEYTINRWAKDGFDEFQQSGQSYKVVILPQFNSGIITAKDDTIGFADLPKTITIRSEADAVGGDGNIKYRWTLNGDDLPETSVDLIKSITEPGEYIFNRWAKDGFSQKDWKLSANSYKIKICNKFDAGILPLINDTLCFTNTETLYDIVLGSEKEASGGDGTISYRWNMRCDWKKAVIIPTSDTTQMTIYVDTTAYDVINNAKATEIYRFVKGNVKDARFPMNFMFTRFAKDEKFSTEWTQAENSIVYTMSEHKAGSGTVYICEGKFPYTHTYTYYDKHTEDTVFTKNGEQLIMQDFTPYLCNNPVTLTAVECLIPEAVVNEILPICENASNLSLGFKIKRGIPNQYKLEFGETAKAQGFVDVDYTAIPASRSIQIKKPTNAKSGVYTLKIYFKDTRPKDICETAYSLSFTLHLDNYIHVKWNDVIFVDNNSNDATDLKFTSYQWYRNGKAIEGATGQYYYQEGGLNGIYYVVMQTTDGQQYISCEKVIVPKTSAPTEKIVVYPVPVEANMPVIIEIPFATEDLATGQLEVYNALGILMTHYTNVSNLMQISPIAQKGLYILKLTTSGNKIHTAKFMVK
jgi:hypothetical protein